jgi:hypothetical protein
MNVGLQNPFALGADLGTHLLQSRGDEISREEGAVEVFSKLRIRSHNELDRVPPESVSAGGMA